MYNFLILSGLVGADVLRRPHAKEPGGLLKLSAPASPGNTARARSEANSAAPIVFHMAVWRAAGPEFLCGVEKYFQVLPNFLVVVCETPGRLILSNPTNEHRMRGKINFSLGGYCFSLYSSAFFLGRIFSPENTHSPDLPPRTAMPLERAPHTPRQRAGAG